MPAGIGRAVTPRECRKPRLGQEWDLSHDDSPGVKNTLTLHDDGDYAIRRMVRASALFLLMSCLAPLALLASQVRLVNLEQMTQRAARIFAGRCTGATVVFDATVGRNVTVATFRVQRAVKGVTGNTVTVRLLDAEAVQGAPADAPSSVATFRNGEDVILFLYGESAQGLTSPVGLGQGRFNIFTDKQGRKLALNPIGNKNLLAGLRPDALARLNAGGGSSAGGKTPRQSEDLDPTALLDAVETLVATEP
jgi:hypothetical protein